MGASVSFQGYLLKIFAPLRETKFDVYSGASRSGGTKNYFFLPTLRPALEHAGYIISAT